MFGFLTVLALQLAAADPAATDPVILPAEFRSSFRRGSQGKALDPRRGARRSPALPICVRRWFSQRAVAGLLCPERQGASSERGAQNGDPLHLSELAVRRLTEMPGWFVTVLRTSPARVPKNWS